MHFFQIGTGEDVNIPICVHHMCAYLSYENSQTATDERGLDSDLIKSHVQLPWCQAGFGPHGLARCTSWVHQQEANGSFRAWLKKARLSAHPMPQGHLGLYSTNREQRQLCAVGSRAGYPVGLLSQCIGASEGPLSPYMLSNTCEMKGDHFVYFKTPLPGHHN